MPVSRRNPKHGSDIRACRTRKTEVANLPPTLNLERISLFPSFSTNRILSRSPPHPTPHPGQDELVTPLQRHPSHDFPPKTIIKPSSRKQSRRWPRRNTPTPRGKDRHDSVIPRATSSPIGRTLDFCQARSDQAKQTSNTWRAASALPSQNPPDTSILFEHLLERQNIVLPLQPSPIDVIHSLHPCRAGWSRASAGRSASSSLSAFWAPAVDSSAMTETCRVHE